MADDLESAAQMKRKETKKKPKKGKKKTLNIKAKKTAASNGDAAATSSEMEPSASEVEPSASESNLVPSTAWTMTKLNLFKYKLYNVLWKKDIKEFKSMGFKIQNKSGFIQALVSSKVFTVKTV